MKTWQRLLSFFSILVLASLACSVPFRKVPEVSSIAISPKSGSGLFKVVVDGHAYTGTHLLNCYIVAPGNKNVVVHNDQFLLNYRSDDLQSFTQEFTFVYTVPGTYPLVCRLGKDNENAWSDDFKVTGPGEAAGDIATPTVTATSNSTPTVTSTSTPTLTPTLTATPTATLTPTRLTNLSLTGSFKFGNEDKYICPDGSSYSLAYHAVTGSLDLAVDYTAGTISATLEGTSGDVTVKLCNWPTSVVRYDLPQLTVSGTINPESGEFEINDEAKVDLYDSCRILDQTKGGVCIAGTDPYSWPFILKGKIDPAYHTGAGKITWKGNQNEGEWSAQ